MNVQGFMGMLFQARDVTHAAHLSTRSFAQHKALDDFYHRIIDEADGFAEAYQGAYGLIGAITIPPMKKKGNIVAFLTDQVSEIQGSRYEICDKEETALQNLIDQILGLYLSTIYKLKFLS